MADQCLEYTLRVACLQSLLQQRAQQAKELPHTPNPVASSSTSAGPASASASTSGSATNRKSYDDRSHFSFDFGSLVSRDSSKSPRYPEKMLKVLDGALQKIAMGMDQRFSDQRFRRTTASFWSSVWPDKNFQRTSRESRKIEDLILAFVTSATKSLKKEEDLADGAWKYELTTQVSLFLDVIHTSLLSLGPLPTELGTRLESYRTRLKPDPKAPGGAIERSAIGSVDRGDNGSVRSFGTQNTSAGAGVGASTASHGAGPGKADDGLRGMATENIGVLFGLNDEWLDGKLKELSRICTEQAALDDLKTLLKRLNTDSPFPYAPWDFDDLQVWNTYRASEVSTLSQMMLSMMQANPSLSQSSDSNNRFSNGGPDLATQMNGMRLAAAAAPAASVENESFTYVPSDPRAVYHELLARCLDWDLEILKTLPEDEDVSLGILSQEHVSLLGDCATRWRLPASFRTWAFLEAIVKRAEQGAVPTACIHEATSMIGLISGEIPVSSWANSDQDGLQRAIFARDSFLLNAMVNGLMADDGYLSSEYADAVQDWMSLDSQEIRHSEHENLVNEMIEGIRMQAYQAYISEASDRIDAEGGAKTRSFAMGMAAWIESSTKKLTKRFPEALTSGVEVVALALGQHLRLWFQDLEDAMSLPPPPGEPGDDMEEAFALYRRAMKMVDLGEAFLPDPVNTQSLGPAFEGTVRLWLDQTALKTKQWADSALAVDTFEATSENGPSSSVTDLFDSFRSASRFLMELNWPDEQQLAMFATRLARIFSLSVNDYCVKVEQLFAKDMSPVEEVVVAPPPPQQGQKAWIEKAKSTLSGLQGEKKIQAFFNFVPESCVKLNNIEAARQQLDKLYNDMRVDDLAAYDTSEPVARPESTSYLFTVKIVHAEGLAQDGSSKNPDAFVILSDEHGNRYAKTRTIYDDADPRWDETFDIPVKGSAWFMCTLRHRSLVGKHDLLGRAYLRLDPSLFADLISKDVLLPLDSRGHILLRISMEGERDDIQFHFGRAFRWLKRTEADMVRTFVDKMTPVLKHTLSRASIKSVLSPASGTGVSIPNMPNMKLPQMNMTLPQIDYNDALTKLTSAYRSAMGTPDYAIPLPSSEIPPVPSPSQPTHSHTPSTASAAASKARLRGPTDQEIEAAIHPLFDYLDANNHTLATTLSKDAMQMVMAKLWKQILMTIEALIVPPLSDKVSEMRALTDGELDIALKWLKFLRDFFYVGGDESGVPLTVLQNAKFNEILSVRIYYDWRTDDLMEECIRGFQSTLKNRSAKPSKSIVGQRNLGTIRARKSAKRALPSGGQNNTEMIMRILRMRQGTQEFLTQQLQTMSVVKLEDPKRKTVKSIGRYGR